MIQGGGVLCPHCQICFFSQVCLKTKMRKATSTTRKQLYTRMYIRLGLIGVLPSSHKGLVYLNVLAICASFLVILAGLNMQVLLHL